MVTSVVQFFCFGAVASATRVTQYKAGPEGVRSQRRDACIRCAYEPRGMRGTNSLVADRATRLCASGDHALRRAPAFQRSPQAAVEAEAVDRRRARDRADTQQACTGPLEAAFLQHAARRRIGDARRRLDRLAVE